MFASGVLFVLVSSCGESSESGPADDVNAAGQGGAVSSGGDAGAGGSETGGAGSNAGGAGGAGGEPIDLCEGLITDKADHPLTALDKPPLLGSATDPAFGTTIRRITDVGGNGVIKPMYSTISAWNADESSMILYEVGGGHHLYDGHTYEYLRPLQIRPADIEQVFWHTNDPDLFFYVDGTELIRYHVSESRAEVVRDFEFCTSNASGGQRRDAYVV